jgi:hypothetical protein
VTFREAPGVTIFPLVREYLLPEIRQLPGGMNLGFRFKIEVDPLSIGVLTKLVIMKLTTPPRNCMTIYGQLQDKLHDNYMTFAWGACLFHSRTWNLLNKVAAVWGVPPFH